VGVFAAAADHGLEGMIWECPDVFTLSDTIVVVVSVHDGGPRYAMWMTGEVAGHRFVPRASGRCDSACRYYAPQSLTLTDGRRVAIGWLQENLDELDGADRSRVGVMSLPRELSLDETGALRSWPARELDSARRKTLITKLIDGRGTVDVSLSARAANATELRVTPVCGAATAIVVRLAGQECADVEIRVCPDGVVTTEGDRALTAAAVPVPRAAGNPAREIGQVRVYYDQGIVEVYSQHAGPVAVICSRRAAYSRIEVEVATRFEAPPCVASVTVWACGAADPSPRSSFLIPNG
jgi:sucrose-6-phosphate hydrolase SacC (GH32 family)